MSKVRHDPLSVKQAWVGSALKRAAKRLLSGWARNSNRVQSTVARSENDKVNYSNLFSQQWESRKTEFFKEVSRRNCPLCDFDEGSFFCTSLDGYEFLICDRCGMLYASEFFPMSFWNNVYHKIPEIAEIEKARASEQGAELSVANADRERFSFLFDKVEELFGPLSGKRYLDVGTFYGAALKVAMEYGMEAYGVEGKREVAEFVVNNSDLEVLHQVSDELEEAVFGGDFDLISLIEVLEHSPNPLESLRRMRSNLKQGGYVLVTVPNADNFELQLLKEHSPHLMGGFIITGHINFFTPDTLRLAMEQTGFEILTQFTQYSSSFQNVYLHYTGRTECVPNYGTITQGETQPVQLDDKELQLINTLSPRLYEYENANNRGPILCAIARASA